MRIFAAILLLLTLIFNWFGYQLLSICLQNNVTSRLEAKLNRAEFADKDLVEFKIPVSLPYQNNQDSFERVDGEIEINGIHYKYVKRRLYNDSIILLCLPNTEKTKIRHAGNDYFKLVNSLDSNPSENTESNTALFKHFLQEFLSGEERWAMLSISLRQSITFPALRTLHCYAVFAELPEIPPESNIS